MHVEYSKSMHQNSKTFLPYLRGSSSFQITTIFYAQYFNKSTFYHKQVQISQSTLNDVYSNEPNPFERKQHAER